MANKLHASVLSGLVNGPVEHSFDPLVKGSVRFGPWGL